MLKWNGHVYNSAGKLLWNASDQSQPKQDILNWCGKEASVSLFNSFIWIEFKKMAGVWFNSKCVCYASYASRTCFLSMVDLVELALEYMALQIKKKVTFLILLEF